MDEALFPKTVIYLSEFEVHVQYNEEIEVYTEVNLNQASQHFITSKLNKSTLVQVTVQELEPLQNPVEEVLGAGNSTITLAGGTDWNPVVSGK